MAGHSKWANIQYRKGKQDARRGKLFSKLIREITISARVSSDPATSPRLRAAIDEAYANNMSKDAIERAIRRGTGADAAANLEEIRYEGYAPGGVAVMVDCMTDNRKRTAGEVRHAFTKSGGNLGTDGSVAYLFTKVGLLVYAAGVSEETLLEAALEAGADDVLANEDGSLEVLCAAEQFARVKDALSAKGLPPESSAITMRASTNVTLDRERAEAMLHLLETLEELDDVQKVYSNAEIPDQILAQLA